MSQDLVSYQMSEDLVYQPEYLGAFIEMVCCCVVKIYIFF